MQGQQLKFNEAVWSQWSEWTWHDSQQAFGRIRRDASGQIDCEWDRPILAARGESQTAKTYVSQHSSINKHNDGSRHQESQGNNRAVHLRPSEGHAYSKREMMNDEQLPQITSTGLTRQEATTNMRRNSHCTNTYDLNDKPLRLLQHAEFEPQREPPGMQHDLSKLSSDSGSFYQPISQSYQVRQYGSSSKAVASQQTRHSDREKADMHETSSTRSFSIDPSAYQQGADITNAMESFSIDEVTQKQTAEGMELSGFPTSAHSLLGGQSASSPGETTVELDPRYQVYPSSSFLPGEVFKVHWSEPQGSTHENSINPQPHADIQNKFGSQFFVGFRRFIVVGNDQGHCTCVPILTYGGKACKKRGVKADKHGIIIEQGQKPRRLDGEPTLGFPPVRMVMRQDSEKLSKESRVNYSKLVTIEHNIKVFFIGSVYPSDYPLVLDAVNHCWNKKILRSRTLVDQ